MKRNTSGFIEIEGCRLYYETRGAGHPVVLIHSGLVDSRMWDDQMDVFAKSFMVIRYDLRGFGKSDPPTTAYSQVNDLHHLLQHLGIERASLVGLSSGGYIAVDFTLAHPSMVDALVLVASALSGYQDWRDDLRETWSAAEAAVKEGDPRRAQDLELALWIKRGGHPDSDAKIQKLAEENRKIYLLDPDLEQRPENPAIDRLFEISAPTLVVLAEHDRPEIATIGDMLVAGIKGAKKVTVPGTGHLVNMRNPEMFNRVVLGFLKGAIG